MGQAGQLASAIQAEASKELSTLRSQYRTELAERRRLFNLVQVRSPPAGL